MKTLSVVIPCFNGARTIAHCLDAISGELNANQIEHEIIVVDDGSTDESVQIMRSWRGSSSLTVVAREENEGKYAALRDGVFKATGELCVFTDADLPYGAKSVLSIYKLLEGGCDIAVGDRSRAGHSPSVCSLRLRPSLSRLLMAVAHPIVHEPIDTQCGLKGFRTDHAHRLFGALYERRFGGDIELLYLARKWKLQLRTLDVVPPQQMISTVRVLRDGLDILRTLVVVPLRWRCRKYPRAI